MGTIKPQGTYWEVFIGLQNIYEYEKIRTDQIKYIGPRIPGGWNKAEESGGRESYFLNMD